MLVLREALRLEKLQLVEWECAWSNGHCCQSGFCCKHNEMWLTPEGERVSRIRS